MPAATLTNRLAKSAAPSASKRIQARAAKTQSMRYGGLNDTEVKVLADRARMAGDATRLKVLLTLDDGAMNVGDMALKFGISQPALSHHLSMMRMVGIIVGKRRAKEVVYALTAEGMSVVRAVRLMG